MAIAAGLASGGMVGWAAHFPETPGRREVRTAVFVAMIGAGLPRPARCGKGDDEEF